MERQYLSYCRQGFTHPVSGLGKTWNGEPPFVDYFKTKNLIEVLCLGPPLRAPDPGDFPPPPPWVSPWLSTTEYLFFLLEKFIKFTMKINIIIVNLNCHHTRLEGVKILLQFSNDETWWALKSSLWGLKKILF